MGSIRLALPCLLLLAACPAPPPPATPPPPDDGVASREVPPPAPADAGVAETRDYAQPPPADAAVATVVTTPPPIDAGAAPVSGRVPATGCLQQGDPRIARLQAEAAAWTKASFEAELRRRGLQPAGLGSTQQVLHRGIGGWDNQQRGARSGTITSPINGGSGRYIAGDSYWTGNAGTPQPWELVKNDRGEYFRLQRRPAAGSSKNVVVCGCEPHRCGPYGSGCPACGATVQQLYGPLPPGATYKGDLIVSYPAAEVVVQREHGVCPQQRPCPPPPP